MNNSLNGKMHREARIFGVPVHSWPQRDVLDDMHHNVTGARRTLHICITSSELMYHARRIPFIRAYIERSHLSLCDSAGVAINAFLRGSRIRRFTGPMLMEESLRFGVERGWRHFFCGGAEGVAELLSRRVGVSFPGLITAGTYCPPFREQTPEEEQIMIDTINRSNADILWVGLGVVRQERWIERYRDRINVPWLIGVGAAFDYFSGTVPRAPKWVRAFGMEWLYRVCQEPWRYKRTSTLLIFGLEGVTAAIFGRAPYLGGRPTDEVNPPEWKGQRNRKQLR